MSKPVERKSRCLHRMACGRRCRKPIAAPGLEFCQRHQAVADDGPEPDLSATLTKGLKEFTSPDAINEFLSRLLPLLAEDRISPRRAAVLAYITNQILRTIAVRNHRTAADQNPKNRPVNIIWSIPGPPRESEPDPIPQPLSAKSAASPTIPSSGSGTRG
jgi:hypothetical protein